MKRIQSLTLGLLVALSAMLVLVLQGQHTSAAPATQASSSGGMSGHMDGTRPGMATVSEEDVFGDSHAADTPWWGQEGTGSFSWTELAWPEEIGATSMGNMVYDQSRGRLVLFIPGDTGNETWELDRTTWQQVATAHTPPPRFQAAMTYDAARQRIVLFGGSDTAGGYRNDTWEYDGSDWSEVLTAHAPSPRREIQYGMTYDSDRHRVVLFGGCDGQSEATCHDDTWEYDGTDWTLIVALTTPSERGDHALVYDAARGRTVLFSGYRDTSSPGTWSVLDDMWAYDGTTWTDITSSPLPPGRGWHMMAYDTDLDRIILFGGLAPDSVFLNDTWEYDGSNWQELNQTGAPAPRLNGHMAYDPARSAVMLVGGRTHTLVFDDFWRVGYGPPSCYVFS